MTFLVFGSTGQVARELQRCGGVTTLSRAAVDLTDLAAVRAAIRAHAPRAVINAAAYTAVDRAEEEETLAHAVNAEAPGAMAETCAAQGIPFVHVSTDYVFDGSGETAWRETDETSPLGAYGRTKLAGENAVRAAGGRHAILRTAWVFSAHGGNFVKTMLRLSDTRDTLNVVADQWGCPTPADDIARALVTMAEAMAAGHAGGTYHFAGAPPINWAGFAREIFDRAGRTMLVHDIPTTDYPTPARRPANSRLDCAAIERDFGVRRPDWRAGLNRVLAELAEGVTG